MGQRRENLSIIKDIHDLLINSKRVEFIEVIDPVLQLSALRAAVDGVREQVDVGVQRKLVHGVDA